MPTELKLQIFFAALLCASLFGLALVMARTLTGLEYAMNRIEEIMGKELRLAREQLDREKDAAQKTAHQNDRKPRNELLINIPFMDRLNQEKQKGGAA